MKSWIFPLATLIRHDFRMAYRNKADWVNVWLFFIIIVSLFPLAIIPERNLLHTLGPGLIWVAALLAILLSFQHFLRPDYEDGSLNLWLLSPCPLPLLLCAKIMAHWMISVFPLILITPILALSLSLSRAELVSLILSLLLGTPALCLLASIVMALTVGLRQQSILLALLFLPLAVPVLIFGTGAVIDVGAGLPSRGAFAILGALLVLALTLAPLAASAALRLSAEL